MSKTTPQDEPVVRPFADFLREQSKGNTHEELSDALHDLVQRVADTGRQGSLTLVITVKPLKGGDNGALLVSDQIKLKVPEHDRKASIFFSHDGNLQRTDPHQLAFEGLRQVGDDVVDTGTGEIQGKEKGA